MKKYNWTRHGMEIDVKGKYILESDASQRSELTDEEIEKQYPINFHHETHDQTCRRQGAKWARDRQKGLTEIKDK